MTAHGTHQEAPFFEERQNTEDKHRPMYQQYTRMLDFRLFWLDYPYVLANTRFSRSWGMLNGEPRGKDINKKGRRQVHCKTVTHRSATPKSRTDYFPPARPATLKKTKELRANKD